MVEPPDDLIPTRTTLIHRLKDWQDQASWQDFFDTYWKLIYGFARKGGLTETEAQDAVQETMLSVAKNMPGFNYDRRLGSFKSWLFQTTRWRITDQLRKRPPASSLPSMPGNSAEAAISGLSGSEGLDWDAVWETEWRNNLLAAALANVKRRIDPQKYQIFDLYVNKQRPADVVAKTFRIPVSQVYMAKHRVAEMIKAEVSRLEANMT